MPPGPVFCLLFIKGLNSKVVLQFYHYLIIWILNKKVNADVFVENNTPKTMKKFGTLVMAAVLGSTLTIGIFRSTSLINGKTIKIEHLSNSPVVGAVYGMSKNGEIVPLDFTNVAKDAMQAVVHIKSTQVQNARNYPHQGYPDPFRDFSGLISGSNSPNPSSGDRKPA